MPATVGQYADQNPVLVEPDESVGSAMTRMAARGWSAAPVVDPGGHPLGLLSLRDIVGKGSGSKARDRMTTPPMVLPEETSVLVAARLIAESGMPRMVVIDREGRVIGVISAVDVVRALAETGQLDVLGESTAAKAS